MFERIKSFFGFSPKAVLGLDPRGTWVGMGGSNSYGGVTIDERSKMTVATYTACIRNISEDIAKLPFKVLKTTVANNRSVRTPLQNDSILELFSLRPNDWMTPFTFKATILQWALGWGNGYAYKEKDKSGKVRKCWPIHPSRVVPKTNEQTGEIIYEVLQKNGSILKFSEDEIFRLSNMSPEGRIGYSVLALQCNTLSLAQQAQEYARNYLANSARPAGVLETLATLDEPARNNLKRSWNEMYSGADNAGKTAVLESGIVYKGISVPMSDMQFLELRQFQVEEIARWFRMPLYKLQFIKTAQGFSTLDAQESDYVGSCLLPWICRFEEEIIRQLMPEYPDDIAPHFEIKGLLKGDMKARIEFYRGMFALSAMTPNEIRTFEDMNPIDDEMMDLTYIQQGFIPTRISEKVALAATKPQPMKNDPSAKVDTNEIPDASAAEPRRDFLAGRPDLKAFLFNGIHN